MPQEQPDHDLNLAPTYMALFKRTGLVVVIGFQTHREHIRSLSQMPYWGVSG